MSVSNLSKDLGSRYFPVPPPFGKASGLSAPAAPAAKATDDNDGKGQAGVSVSISPDALAAYDASLARSEHAQGSPMDDGARFGAGYDLRELLQREVASEGMSQPPPEAMADGEPDPVSMTPASANGGASLRAEDLSRAADLAMEDVRQKLDHAFALENITRDPPVSLSFDAMGAPVVGEHPDKTRIEALFAQNPELANDVRTASALKENAVTWEKASLYTSAHEQTSRLKGAAAADALTELFIAMGDDEAQMTYGPSGLDLTYGGEPPKDHLTSIASRLGLGAAAA